MKNSTRLAAWMLDQPAIEQNSVPARTTNVEFGGSDRKTLFITTDSADTESSTYPRRFYRVLSGPLSMQEQKARTL